MSSADSAVTQSRDLQASATAAVRPTLLSRLATRYVDGWTWYARNGYSPPAPEPGYPMSRPVAVQACCIELRRAPTPRFVLLFGAGASGR
jgi:hypothetical protein